MYEEIGDAALRIGGSKTVRMRYLRLVGDDENITDFCSQCVELNGDMMEHDSFHES